MLLVTSIIASVLTIIFIKLSFAVIGLRRKNKVGLGSGGYEDLERAIRAQGNFAEYVPFGIILLACLELNGAPWWLVAIPGIALIIGRLIHAKGINVPPPDFSKRILGMKFTFNTLIALVILNLAWSSYLLLALGSK
ncbi:MAPEG family protein [Polynucleobacter sp. MWH-UH23A]|uniref:MAPEG family protein n=1 Tax=Polynucleobacter sp. MWH-UH23A TaxID=1855613 RepID=UPI003364C10C